MTISIKPTASGSTIEQDGSTILTVDGSGNITPSNNLYPKVPAFSAYKTGSQSVSDAVNTKVTFDTERFDTTNAFDSSTNYRFTPQVAGYYQVNYTLRMQGGTITTALIKLYKNGSAYETGPINRENTSSSIVITNSTLVYLNGSTDYIEVYGYCDVSSGSPSFDGAGSSADSCFFSASLVSV